MIDYSNFINYCNKRNSNMRTILHNIKFFINIKYIITISIFLTFAPLFAQTQSYTVPNVPNPRSTHGGFVTDPEGILGKEGEQINNRLIVFEQETGNEISVVVLPSIGDLVPKDFAVDLFNTWGIGKKGKDNGLLLLLVIDQKRWEFETGYGLEGILPDVLLHRIGQDVMLPHFKNGNYGKGVDAGIDVILKRLNEGVIYSESENSTELENDTFNPDTIVFYIVGSILTLVYLISSLILGFNAPSMTKKGSLENDFILPKSRLYYTAKVIFWPAVIWGLFLTGFNLADAFLAYAFANVMLLLERARRNFLLGRISLDPYRRYQIWTKDHRGMFRFLTFLFPAGLLPMYFFYRSKRKLLREEPRECPSCKVNLTLLDENADDAFLTEGKRMEEYVKSIDYDVWLCGTCDHVDIYPYENEFTSFNRCPSCSHKTYHTVSSRTLVSPTCSSSGKGERKNKCEFCKKGKTETYTIPARDCSSSSGGSGSSSSGGGSSFGGGSSGGGGAGGSW